MMDTKGGRKTFSHCNIVEYAQTKNIFTARRKIHRFLSPQFSVTKEDIQLNLAGNICMTDWRLPLFGCKRNVSLIGYCKLNVLNYQGFISLEVMKNLTFFLEVSFHFNDRKIYLILNVN